MDGDATSRGASDPMLTDSLSSSVATPSAAGRGGGTLFPEDDDLANLLQQSQRRVLIQLNLPDVKKELLLASVECSQRGLTQSYKWLSELIHALRNVKLPRGALNALGMVSLGDGDGDDNGTDADVDTYLMAKSYFDLKEYDRCRFFTEASKDPKIQFLHFYSWYLSGEKKRLDNQTDTIPSMGVQQQTYLKELRGCLQKLHQQKELDGYCLYLYGIVLKGLSLNEEAKGVLIEAINRQPCLWGAWLELAFHVSDRATLLTLDLPDHWVKSLFLAHTYLELQLNEAALEIYFGLQEGGFQGSTYLLAQVAIAYHNMREVDRAVGYFRQLSQIDPYRLDNLDTYSNLLYVKEQRVELAGLAHRSVEIDKYRTETCCVVGNYYSLRSQHAKAVVYFQRALKLNPNYLSAWTLMGHEYMELKNANAAIQSYRRAIEVNKRDYRAWYGLGQTYELLKMHYYCLYYYKRSHELRPNDSRMLVALGESYEKLDRHSDAAKCFWKAHCVGDIEGGIALFQLARMYEYLGEHDQAANAFNQYIVDAEDQGFVVDRDKQSKAYKYLAHYYFDRNMLDHAFHYAQKCTEFVDTREDGKCLLKVIAAARCSAGACGNKLIFRDNDEEEDEDDDDEDDIDDDDAARPAKAASGSSSTAMGRVAEEVDEESSSTATPMDLARGQGLPAAVQGGRNRPSYTGASPALEITDDDDGDSGGGGGGGRSRRTLEPMILTYTP